jgi:micrococcal nuclease
MRGRLALALGVALAAAIAAGSAPAGGRGHETVARVVDGDTIELTSGARVRFVQIDTPELGTGECYSHAAARALARWLPRGSAVVLEADPRLDQVDAYGRLLRYVWSRGRNLNLDLVRDGAATVWLYHGEYGKYAGRLLALARVARAAHRGLWGACPKAVWDPYGPATTGQSGPPAKARAQSSGRCDPSYPGVCIPPPPPDLDCKDVPYRHFRVLPPDPHHFDGNHDGYGCEF